MGASFLCAVILDQLTKRIVRRTIEQGEVVDLVPGFSLHHSENTGVAFGMFAEHPSWVVLVTALVGALLIAVVVRMPLHSATAAVGAGLLGGGALGNLIDRARLGAVTDFIGTPLIPTFNVADTCLTVGIALLIVAQLRTGHV